MGFDIRVFELEELTGVEYRSRVEITGRVSRGLVEEISRSKKEPEWMRRLRLRALDYFEKAPVPQWLPYIQRIDLDEITTLYTKPDVEVASDWSDLPEDVRRIYERLGLPETYAKYLAGLTTVLDSESVFVGMKDFLRRLGVVMVPMEEAVQKYPDLVKKYFSRVFPYTDHKFAALHYALWSGGVFVYVPKGVRVPYPVEAFFFLGKEMEGQFEHSLIVADEGSELVFIEGCSAPRLRRESFHDGMVEIYAHPSSRVSFVTVQNWSRNVINFNNKRAVAEENAFVEWVEGSIGSKITVTYPSTVLRGEGAKTVSTLLSISNGGYIKDTGSKVIHAAPRTSSRVLSKSIVANGGLSVYRGLTQVNKGAVGSFSHVECESLILDEKSGSYTYPIVHLLERDADVGHEASTLRLSEDQVFYLMSRGLRRNEAVSLVVNGFVRDVLRKLPFEFASMLKRVVELEFEEYGGVG
ncbi:FeS assembly protein SufB [Thermogladius calderae 1633]|uniref:FeS assembly protein SufB n=1 Tax=Thermogladius calderae (strain DSM 22663 / VKM B-2946 / 1633) TaxID=1184251 RepID=I3TFH6_THEC1|nr:Fe-S cluster assembly protein SufB [Thermogladius calderae]AFK51514.1 FeS assembly protein SufB [Thermogladius calderae 1633]